MNHSGECVVGASRLTKRRTALIEKYLAKGNTAYNYDMFTFHVETDSINDKQQDIHVKCRI